jgi:uncharacterized 2Fe-2S/4Fe-4S cluster protein (DUF4445 family)
MNIPGKENLILKLLPSNKEIKVKKGYNLRQAILDCGIHLDSSCGGVGTCRRCKVRVISGMVSTKTTGKKSSEKNGMVLACKSIVLSDAIVYIPDKTFVKGKIENDTLVLKNGKAYRSIDKKELTEIEVEPWVVKERIYVKRPTFQDNTSDLYRLKKAVRENSGIQEITVPLEVVRKMPLSLRKNDWNIQILFDRVAAAVLDIRSPESPYECYGIALDIGTTTLAAQMADLKNGKIVESETDYNPQIRYGEDVINRIVYSIKEDGLKNLNKSVVGSVDLIISNMLDRSGVDPEDVPLIIISGNSTMTHLFYGVSPKFLREEPYITVLNSFPACKGKDLGLNTLEDAVIRCSPGMTSYLGGDITSGVIATGIANRQELCLLIDMGTNGEILVGNNEWMIGCSCSAGPAFEGGGVRWG